MNLFNNHLIILIDTFLILIYTGFFGGTLMLQPLYYYLFTATIYPLNALMSQKIHFTTLQG